MSDAIVTRRLTKYYGRRPVVRDLNLRLPRGCVFGLLGRNGAGKSTALKMLVGMVQPDYGSVELLGEDLCASDFANPGPHCLPGRRAPALHLDDH